MKERSYKYYAKNNPSWTATLTSEELKEALSGEMDRKLKVQWEKENKKDMLQVQKDHDDWYGAY